MVYKLIHLKKLINAMSGTEKRHFTLLSSAFAKSEKEQLYVQLFQALSNPKYEHSRFSKDMSSELYATVKRRLLKNLLKSLRIFYQDQSIDIALQNYLSEVEILDRLSLPDQSLFILQKANKLATTYEKFELLLQILSWERKLQTVLDNSQRTIESIAEERQVILEQLMQILNIETIYSNTQNFKKQYGYWREKTEEQLALETIRSPKMITYDACNSRKARFYFDFIHALYYWMTFNHKEAYQYSKNLLDPEMQLILPNDYINGVLEHVTSCVGIGRFKEAFENLEWAAACIKKQKLNQTHSFNTKIFYYETTCQLLIYNYTGAKRKLTEAIAKAERGLAYYEKMMPLETRNLTYLNLMNACIGIGNIKKADAIWEMLSNQIIKPGKHNLHDELYLFRLFNLLQSRVYEVLPSIALSAQRYYKKAKNHKAHFDLELKISGILLKAHHFENEKVKTDILNKIKQALIQYISGLEGVHHFQEYYSFYLIWTESMLSKKPFHEAAALWYKKHRRYFTQG